MSEQIAFVFIAVVTGGLLTFGTMCLVVSREEVGKHVFSSVAAMFMGFLLYSIAMYIVAGGLA